ncbi:MAG: methyltransferase domain-containing protein [Polyangiaceae bacterium]|nr:methyltransferase domain-containing protein [Polyangiaceae bacterium]
MTETAPAQYSFLAGFDGEWRDTWWNADFLALTAQRHQFHNVQNVLDVGCGVGHWGRTLLPHLPKTAKLTGIDYEASFAEKANGKALELGLSDRLSYRQASADALPFDNDTFDMATCQTVLMHLPDVPRALAEIKRVLRPGGLFLACEPDNIAEAMALFRGSPPPPWKDLLRLIDFQHTCELGKQALGRGDSSIGEKLPGLFTQAGFNHISTYQNDKCAWLVPPYQSRDQALDLQQFLSWIDAGLCLFAGNGHDDSVKLYAAGGGDPAQFEELWQLGLTVHQGFKKAVLAGEYHGGRAVTFYMVSGRK